MFTLQYNIHFSSLIPAYFRNKMKRIVLVLIYFVQKYALLDQMSGCFLRFLEKECTPVSKIAVSLEICYGNSNMQILHLVCEIGESPSFIFDMTFRCIVDKISL